MTSVRAINSIRHVGIVVQDLDSAISFWSQTLGLEVIVDSKEEGQFIDKMMGLNNTELRTIKMGTLNRCMVELLHFYSHEDVPTWNGSTWSTGITHVALNVQDIDYLAEKICNAGGRLLGPIQESTDKKVRVAYAQAPDGVLLELVSQNTPLRNDQ